MQRKKKIAAVAGVLFMFAAGAIAYILITATFEGSHKGVAGTTTAPAMPPLQVSFAQNTFPGGAAEPVSVTATGPEVNTTLQPTDKMTTTITSANEATCKASFFETQTVAGSVAAELVAAGGLTKPLEIKGEAPGTAIPGLLLHENGEGAVDETGCETTEITVAVHITGPVKVN